LRDANGQLRVSEARFARLAEAGIIGILVATLDHKLVAVNDAFLGMVGYARAELLSDPTAFASLTPPEWSELDERAFPELKAWGIAPPREKEYLRKDGARVAALVGAALLEGSADEWIAFVLDITDRRRAEAAVQILNKELEQRVEERTAQLALANRELEA